MVNRRKGSLASLEMQAPMPSNINPKILAKIKKCLALASSDNPNEAATALRQAHALMAANGVTAEEITMADIGEAEAKSRTMARSKPAQWEVGLASTVGSAFGCQLMLKRYQKNARSSKNDGAYIFVGIAAQAQIASYTFDVLSRKCKKARSDWISNNLKGISLIPGGKRKVTALGDEFALGWVHMIARLVRDFAQPDSIKDAISNYINKNASTETNDEELMRKPKFDGDKATQVARMHGMRAAENESIHRPVNGREQTLQLL